jgi:hypothetical protein
VEAETLVLTLPNAERVRLSFGQEEFSICPTDHLEGPGTTDQKDVDGVVNVLGQERAYCPTGGPDNEVACAGVTIPRLLYLRRLAQPSPVRGEVIATVGASVFMISTPILKGCRAEKQARSQFGCQTIAIDIRVRLTDSLSSAAESPDILLASSPADLAIDPLRPRTDVDTQNQSSASSANQRAHVFGY